jgi:hypothetical protein
MIASVHTWRNWLMMSADVYLVWSGVSMDLASVLYMKLWLVKNVNAMMVS